MRWPPGPSGFRALRYLGWKRDLIGFVERCRRDYGGVCGIRFPGLRGCLISDPQYIERVLVTHASRTRKWEIDQFRLLLGQGLLTSRGELWKKQRTLINPVFSPARVGGYAPKIVEHALACADGWRSKTEVEPGGSREVEIYGEMLRLSLQVAASALFGADASGIAEFIEETHELLGGQFEGGMAGIPIPLSVPTPGNLRAKRAIRRLDAAVLGLIAERRKNRTAGTDFLGALIAAQDDSGAGMSDQQLRDECMTMILAGHETTATVLTWTLWLLARHPEAQARCAEEAYLKNVVSESTRLYPPVWAIGRIALESLDLGEYLLPAGTNVVLVPYLAHRDPGVFSEADAFRPERWDDPAIRAIPRCSYIPFGAGPRKCVGMNFAVLETSLILRTLLSRFLFEAVDGERVELQPAVTLRPRGGISLRVTPRAASL